SAVHDPLGHLGRCAPGAVVGAAGAVVQAVLALLVVALEPVVGALARDAHRLGGVGHRPPLLAYPTHEQPASLERQPGITVGHEDLRDLVVTLRQATPHPEVLLTSTNHRECHQRPGRVHLDEADSGVLEPAGLRVRPQMLTASEYTQILTVLAAAEETVPGPQWAAGLETIDEPTLDEVPITVTVDDIDIHLQTVQEDSAPPAELNEEPEAEPQPSTDDDARDKDEAAEVHTLHRPVIAILGAVELDGARGTSPASKDTVQARRS